ncbi:hydroxylysine kinase-like [Stylophora pistillata]|uniref:Hydroxylysine kinase n=1 Tax=Stylophora pistillata TaxID=50429 RepID=A0A2B4RPR7_STYPI|nr:hydroxylysine kinase-like [Stylophora pistillata]PFX18530.1 Hydroxylysine kinase [Stylophora pistillata]
MSGSAYSRPFVNLEFAEQLVKKLYNFERISEIKELESFGDQNFYVRGHRRNTVQEQVASNFRSNDLEQEEYVLKVLNSNDSRHVDFVEAESAAMYFLRERGFPCPLLYPLAGGVDTKSLIRVPASPNAKYDANKSPETAEYKWCIVRLISFLPGQTGDSLKRKMSFENLFMVGKFIGSLSKAFQDFESPVSLSKSDRWCIENLLSLKSHVSFVKGEENKKLVCNVLDRFAAHVTPKICLLRQGTVHSDLTETNLLFDTSCGELRISGLIDFGDIRWSCFLFELATAVASFTKEDDVLASSGYFIDGYQAVFPLTDLEFELLYDVVCARLCQVFLITSEKEREFPNNEYAKKLQTDYLRKLKAWSSNSRDEVMSMWRKVEEYGQKLYSA